MAKVIFVASTSFSGSTMIDLVLANDPKGFSFGEASFLYRPEQPHHLTPRCACADPTCRIWQNLRGVSVGSLYRAFFEQHPEIDFVVDSSKDPLWIADRRSELATQGIDSKVLLIWKTPQEVAASFASRGSFAQWSRHWLNYHRLFASQVGNDFVGLRYQDFARNPERLSRVCEDLDIVYFPEKSSYWNKVHHTLFGNRSARRHLNSVEAGLKKGSYTDDHATKSIYYSPPRDPDILAKVEAQLAGNPLLRETEFFLDAMSSGNRPATYDLSRIVLPAHEVTARRVRRALPRPAVLRAALRTAVNRSPVPRSPATAPHRFAFLLPGHLSAVVGGAEQQAGIIIDALKRRYGHECAISYHCRRANLGYATPTHETWVVPELPLLSRFSYFWDIPFLVAEIARQRPQVIYQRDAGAYTAAAVLAARRTGARTILHIAHDKDVTPLVRPYPRNALKRVDKKLLEWALPRIDVIVAQTPRQAELLEIHYGRGADMVLPNVQKMQDKPIVKDTPPLVLWVANSTESKRPQLFVDLAEALANTPARFVMVGRTRRSDELLLNRINALSNIEHLGPQTQEAVYDLMARAVLFVNTSDAEGFPNTFIQAWMRETPVVSIEVNPGGALDDGRIGRLTGTADALAPAVRELLGDPRELSTMGAEARRRAEARYGLSSLNPLLDVF